MLPALMKVASLSVHNESIVKSTALTCSQKLYQYLMEWGAKNNQLSLITNSILVHLGFLKVSFFFSFFFFLECLIYVKAIVLVFSELLKRSLFKITMT